VSDVDPGGLGAFERPNLKQMVAGRLRELIFAGALRPGSKIDQDELAQRFGISKLPVREALITLESEGLVDNLPRRGSFVAPLSREDITDHYDVFGVIAGMAAERAASALAPEDLDVLDDLVVQMEKSTSTAEQEDLNYRFHRLINRAGASRRMRSVLQLLGKSIPTRYFELISGWAETAHTQHREIVDAFRRGDAEAARHAVERHLRDSAQHAVHILEERGFWEDEAQG
jgi:DNA-binding GntR family transcriptional regulator